jgi:hypothetical protein
MLAHEANADLADLMSRPIWRLLLPSGDTSSDEEDSVALWSTAVRGEDWAESLKGHVFRIPLGGVLVVTWNNRVWRVLAGLFTRGRSPAQGGPGRRKLRRFLELRGFEVVAEYSLWPSADAPRIGLPRHSLPGVRWMRHSGVLGGGGRVLWKRVLARSPLTTALAWLVPAGSAFVVRRVQ